MKYTQTSPIAPILDLKKLIYEIRNSSTLIQKELAKKPRNYFLILSTSTRELLILDQRDQVRTSNHPLLEAKKFSSKAEARKVLTKLPGMFISSWKDYQHGMTKYYEDLAKELEDACLRIKLN